MKKTTTIDRNFEGLTLENNYYVYNDDLNIEGDAAIFENIVIKGNLVVNGKLECRENLEVFGGIYVSGDFIAADVIANNISVAGDLIASGDVIAYYNTINGNATIAGAIRTMLCAVGGNLTAENLVGGLFAIYGKLNVSGKIYASLVKSL